MIRREFLKRLGLVGTTTILPKTDTLEEPKKALKTQHTSWPIPTDEKVVEEKGTDTSLILTTEHRVTGKKRVYVFERPDDHNINHQELRMVNSQIKQLMWEKQRTIEDTCLSKPTKKSRYKRIEAQIKELIKIRNELLNGTIYDNPERFSYWIKWL